MNSEQKAIFDQYMCAALSGACALQRGSQDIAAAASQIALDALRMRESIFVGGGVEFQNAPLMNQRITAAQPGHASFPSQGGGAIPHVAHAMGGQGGNLPAPGQMSVSVVPAPQAQGPLQITPLG